MNTPTLSPPTGSRWMNWKAKARKSENSTVDAPTKPSKPNSVGFEGAPSPESPEIEEGPDPAEWGRACGVLNRTGVRIMALDGGATIGVWSDLDGPEVRAALRTFGTERLPVRYLDSAGVPMRYKARRIEGEPVPKSVLAALEQHPADPWKVRDRMLSEMGWCATGTPWAAWKAAGLNRQLRELGTSGQPGRITAETIRHGEQHRGCR